MDRRHVDASTDPERSFPFDADPDPDPDPLFRIRIGSGFNQVNEIGGLKIGKLIKKNN